VIQKNKTQNPKTDLFLKPGPQPNGAERKMPDIAI
jgi:hypothetical protein